MMAPAAENDRFTNYYVYDDELFNDRKNRLGLDGMKVCLALLDADQGSGETISPDRFKAAYCDPVKAAEKWLTKMKKTYGKNAECPMFERVAQFLMMTSRGRQRSRLVRQRLRKRGSSAAGGCCGTGCPRADRDGHCGGGAAPDFAWQRQESQEDRSGICRKLDGCR